MSILSSNNWHEDSTAGEHTWGQGPGLGRTLLLYPASRMIQIPAVFAFTPVYPTGKDPRPRGPHLMISCGELPMQARAVACH